MNGQTEAKVGRGAFLAISSTVVIERIRLIADVEGRRRFIALGERYDLPMGEYEGRPCALVADVALVFGVTPQAVRKALVDIRERLPDAAVECNPSEVHGSNLKLRPAVTRIVVIFWRGFLALAQSGRGPAAKEVREFLVEAETQERLATATAHVTRETAERALAPTGGALPDLLVQASAALAALAPLASRMADIEGRLAAVESRPARPLALTTRSQAERPPGGRTPEQGKLALVPPPGAAGPSEDDLRSQAEHYGAARRAAHVHQKTLAVLVAARGGFAHLSRSSICAWERWKRQPTEAQWMAWRKALLEFEKAARYLATRGRAVV